MNKNYLKKISIILVIMICMLSSIVYGYYEIEEIKLKNNYDFGYSYYGISNGLQLVVVDEKYGFINTKGEEVVPCIYDKANDFMEGIARVVLNDKIGYINTKGEEIVPCIYDDGGSFENEFAKVYKDNKWGYINTKGEEIIPCIYDGGDNFKDGKARVKLNNKLGVINTKGEEVAPFIYDEIGYFESPIYLQEVYGGSVETINLSEKEMNEYINNIGYYTNQRIALVKKDNKYGYINEKGEEIIPCIYHNGEGICNGLGKVCIDGKYGLVNTKGEEVIPCIYDDINRFALDIVKVIKDNEGQYINIYTGETMKIVSKDGKYGTIDEKGKEIIPCIYDGLYNTKYKLIAVKRNGKYGYVNEKGEEIIPCIYDEFDRHIGELTRVIRNGKYGCVNEKGEEVIPCIYDYIHNSSSEIIEVEKDGKSGLVNINGEEILPCIYDYMFGSYENLIEVVKDEKYGLINFNGELVIPTIYEATTYLGDELIGVKKDGKWGIINIKNEIVLPCIYDTIYLKHDNIINWDDLKYKMILATIDNQEYILKITEKQEGRKTPSKVYINGQEVKFEAYNIQGNNYFKLRDLAYALNNTEKQFEVTWNEEYNRIDLISNKNYTSVGNELENININGENKIGTRTTSSIYLDNGEVELKAYNIEGYNYFKLRDLLEKIDCEVIYDESTRNININTANGYVAE